MTNSIGQTIKKLRKERNFTQEELAELLGVTSQAVSKWENETGCPDISQIVPLASIFGVSTDTLFGIAGTTENEEALKIIGQAHDVQEYGKLETYLRSYDLLIEGLKKYPNNLILLTNCMNLGLSLSLPENGWIYSPDRAKEIAEKTTQQAKLIIAYTNNASDSMRAHEVLVFLYSSQGDFDKAMSEAQNFPAVPVTAYSNMATVSEYMKDHSRTISCLCSDIDYSIQQLEYNASRLGKAYYNSGKFTDAIEVYETYFCVMKAIFGEEFPPYHDFDSGDCYILLAQAYLAVGETEKAMDNVERAAMYYLDLFKNHAGDVIEWKTLANTPLLNDSEIGACVRRSLLKTMLSEKLDSEEIGKLRENERFGKLCDMVDELGE